MTWQAPGAGGGGPAGQPYEGRLAPPHLQILALARPPPPVSQLPHKIVNLLVIITTLSIDGFVGELTFQN